MNRVVPLLPALFFICTTGCASAPAQPAAPPAPPAPKVLDAKAQKIEQLLQRADTAFSMQSLTEPVSENAYDLYRAVLIMEPANARGQEGIKKVSEAYPAQVEEAFVGKQYDAALRKLQKGLILFPANAQLKQLETQVKTAKQAQIQTAAKTTTISLSATELSAKTPALETTLRNVAKRVAASNELLTINARNDAEGRWIYKTMKESAGTRIRGDIKISSAPSIQIHPATP
ncbi:MAG: hypothetical protein RL497_2150 [Pseudomonadota bacterium]|jgi:hypothetical protein